MRRIVGAIEFGGGYVKLVAVGRGGAMREMRPID